MSLSSLNQMTKPSTITLNQTADELIGHRINSSRGNYFLFTYSIKNLIFTFYQEWLVEHLLLALEWEMLSGDFLPKDRRPSQDIPRLVKVSSRIVDLFNLI